CRPLHDALPIAGADQRCKALALLGAKRGVHRPKGAKDRVLQPLGASNTEARPLAGPALVEARGGDRVREGREGPPVVDLGLGPLDLQVIENPGHLGDLMLVEIEMMREEPKGAPNAERSRSESPLASTRSALSPVAAHPGGVLSRADPCKGNTCLAEGIIQTLSHGNLLS